MRTRTAPLQGVSDSGDPRRGSSYVLDVDLGYDSSIGWLSLVLDPIREMQQWEA